MPVTNIPKSGTRFPGSRYRSWNPDYQEPATLYILGLLAKVPNYAKCLPRRPSPGQNTKIGKMMLQVKRISLVEQLSAARLMRRFSISLCIEAMLRKQIACRRDIQPVYARLQMLDIWVRPEFSRGYHKAGRDL